MEDRNKQGLTRAAVALFALLAAVAAHGAAYDGFLEQGTFYLGRGAAYGSDALRALEKARETDPRRASTDRKLLLGLARAYALTSRFTEAYWTLEDLAAGGGAGPETQALRDQILTEAGLGRLRLRSAVALAGLAASLEPAQGTRLDVASRRALERLNELLARSVSVKPDGLVLLAPEGRYLLRCQGAELFAPRAPVPIEVWAGDEVEYRLIPFHPAPADWKVAPRSRSVALAWPGTPGTVYELVRDLDGKTDSVYRGPDAQFVDKGLSVGARPKYTLKALGPQGEVVAASVVETETLPPVSRVSASARLDPDLRVELSWTMGGGTAERVRVIRRSAGGEQFLPEITERETVSRGGLRDGPFLPGKVASEITYAVEAWLADGVSPAAEAETRVVVPPRVERVSAVVTSIDRGGVVVQWETAPRDGAAQGYAIFRKKDPAVEGELVGRLDDAFAREFLYAVEDPLKASEWRHFVVPFVGDSYILDPETIKFQGQPPEEGFERRSRKSGALPNVGLSWDPYPGAKAYAVTTQDGEVLVKRPYIEIQGLQTPLMASDHKARIFALDADGKRVPLAAFELHYEHYPRSGSKETGR